MKVAVIGGGIAGFCAAIALERIGVDTEIFERSSSIREIGAGLSLWPNATFALRELGLLEPCARAASRVRRIGLMDPVGREWASVDISGHATPALCLDRPALLSVLLAAVDPERIRVSHG
jgi:2-polyprenyl-6-methoxyphenol hydroxylase-like FAD-dependent oxidoreductase